MGMANTNGGAGAQPVASSGQPAAPAAQPTPGSGGNGSQIDLTQLAEFRAFQSTVDRDKAEQARKQALLDAENASLRAKIADIEARQQQTQSDMDRQRIEALPPAERAAAYAELYTQQQRQNSELAERGRIIAEAQAFAAAKGVRLDDPRLEEAAKLGPTPAGLAALKAGINLLSALPQTPQQPPPPPNPGEVQQIRNDALAQAGVLATSNAPPSVIAPQSERDRAVAAFRGRWQTLRGKGWENPSVRQFMSDLENSGFSLSDLGY